MGSRTLRLSCDVETNRRRTMSRAVAAVIVSWGAGLFIAPERVRDAVLPRDQAPPVWVIRVLAVRLVAQHSVVWRWPTTGVVVRGSALIDAAHALVMAVLVRRGGRHRRAAAVSAVMAAAAAAAAWRTRPH